MRRPPRSAFIRASSTDNALEELSDDLAYAGATFALLPIDRWPDALRPYHGNVVAELAKRFGAKDVSSIDILGADQVAEARRYSDPLGWLSGTERDVVALRAFIEPNGSDRHLFDWPAIAAHVGLSEAEAKQAGLDGLSRIIRQMHGKHAPDVAV